MYFAIINVYENNNSKDIVKTQGKYGQCWMQFWAWYVLKIIGPNFV